MKRRILLVVSGATLMASLAGAASALPAVRSSNYWGCAGSDDLDVAVCLKDPDVPELPRLPRLPD